MCGDVAPDQIGALFKRVSTVLKQQPFDFLLVAGSFVSDDCKEDFSSEAHLRPYLDGSEKIPIMTYFCHKKLDPNLVCDNLICVGPFGLLNIDGLDVAFLWDPLAAQILVQQVRQEGDLLKTGIDVFICSTWPENVFQHLGPNEVPQLTVSGSSDVSESLVRLAPRYAFVPSPGDVFFERRPYKSDKGYATRFLGLAPVGNAAKQKWLFAFKLTKQERLPEPEGTSANPFVKAQPEQKQHSIRFEEEAAPSSSSREPRQKKARFDSKARGDQCWFCLDSPNVEQHLVVSVGNESYMAVAKGAFTANHVLIVPIEHRNSLIQATKGERAEVERCMRNYRSMLKDSGMRAFIFERHVPQKYSSPHGHIQALPISADHVKNVESLLQGWKTIDLKDDEEIPWETLEKEIASRPYFWIHANDKLLYEIDPQKTPPDFGRFIYGNLVGERRRIVWQTCVVSKDAETKMAQDFVKVFKKYE